MLPKERAILRPPLPLPRNPARVFGRATVPVNRGLLRLRLAAGPLQGYPAGSLPVPSDCHAHQHLPTQPCQLAASPGLSLSGGPCAPISGSSRC
ncbi:hypothetical protein ACOMHN_056226 [Nucella lapillus]